MTVERKGKAWSVSLDLGGSQLSFIMNRTSVLIQCDQPFVLVNAADEKRDSGEVDNR